MHARGPHGYNANAPVGHTVGTRKSLWGPRGEIGGKSAEELLAFGGLVPHVRVRPRMDGKTGPGAARGRRPRALAGSRGGTGPGRRPTGCRPAPAWGTGPREFRCSCV